MKIRIRRTIFLISSLMTAFFQSSYTAVYGQSSQDYQNGLATLPYPFSTVVEHDTTTSTFFGRVKIDGFDYLASIASDTGKPIILSKLPSFGGWLRGASALDIDNQRFFFIALSSGIPVLCVVDIARKKVVGSHVLSHFVKNIEFDPLTGSLLGISRSDVERFVSIDPNTGNITEINELTLVKSTGIGAFMEGENFYFVGSWGGRDHFCVVDRKTGSMKELSGESIAANEYSVKLLKAGVGNDVLFTRGVQSCTGVAGYDSDSGIGFIAHFTPNYGKIDEAFVEIDGMIQEIANDRGLEHMKIVVVGGVRDNQNSTSTLMAVYSQLVERHGVSFDDITKSNTGVSHTIVIHNGESKIF